MKLPITTHPITTRTQLTTINSCRESEKLRMTATPSELSLAPNPLLVQVVHRWKISITKNHSKGPFTTLLERTKIYSHTCMILSALTPVQESLKWEVRRMLIAVNARWALEASEIMATSRNRPNHPLNIWNKTTCWTSSTTMSVTNSYQNFSVIEEVALASPETPNYPTRVWLWWVRKPAWGWHLKRWVQSWTI